MSDMLYQLIFPLSAVVSLASLVFVLLYVNTRFRKMEVAIRQQAPPDFSKLSSAVAGLQWEVAGLGERLAKLESEPHECASQNPVSIRAGMNLNKRTQALRQHRLGQGPAEIAKALEMPRAEIDLLVKVQRIVTQALGT